MIKKREDLRLRATGGKFFYHNKSKGKGKKGKRPNVQIAKSENKKNMAQNKLFFYGKNNHLKKDCLKWKNWFENTDENCHEINLTDVPPSSRWVDSASATIYVIGCTQGFLSSLKPNDGEKTIAMGNWKESRFKAACTYRLVLDF